VTQLKLIRYIEAASTAADDDEAASTAADEAQVESTELADVASGKVLV
jgi:hypothetical protein